jgi:WXG100 family type VII secretion target
MAKSIKIDPEKMREIGLCFVQSSETNKTMAAELKKLIDSLVADWQGASQERFHIAYSDAHKQLETVSITLKSVGDELKAIAERFRTADDKA